MTFKYLSFSNASAANLSSARALRAAPPVPISRIEFVLFRIEREVSGKSRERKRERVREGDKIFIRKASRNRTHGLVDSAKSSKFLGRI